MITGYPKPGSMWLYGDYETKPAEPRPTPQPKGTPSMHSSRIIFVMNDDVRQIEVQYEPGGRSYSYKTMDQTIQVDDIVVIPTDTRHNYTCGKVTEVDTEVDMMASGELKWIIDKVDIRHHEQLAEQEKVMAQRAQDAQRRKQKAELRKTLMADQPELFTGLAIANHSEEESEE